MRIRNALAALGVGVFSIAAVSIPSASAGPHLGCPYPYVCFYKTKTDWTHQHPTAKFKDITPDWQVLTRSKGSYGAWNTRNDDIAFFHFTNGRVLCANPNSGWFGGTWVVDAIRIDSSSHCPGALPAPADTSDGEAPTPALTTG